MIRAILTAAALLLAAPVQVHRAARRPKPPSLKEQALATLEAMEKLWESCGDNPTDIIRCSLEALPDE